MEAADLESVLTLPSQTPAYYAVNRARYSRQDLIRRIEGLTGRELLVYFALSELTQEDVPAFADRS